MSYQNGIINQLINNQIEIFFPDNDEQTISEENIVSESLTLKQSICDTEALTFGGCIASECSLKLISTSSRQFDNSLVGKWISVKITQRYADPDELVYPSSTMYPGAALYPGKVIGEESFWIFSGYIDSAKWDKSDKNALNIVAYDALAILHKTDATDALYNRLKDGAYFHLADVVIFCLRQVTNGVMDISYNYDLTEFIVTDDPAWIEDYQIKNTDWLNNQSRITFGKLLKDYCEILAGFGVIEPNSGKGRFTIKKLRGSVKKYEFYEALDAEDYLSTGYTDFRFSIGTGDSSGKSVKGVDENLVGGISDAFNGAVDKTYDFTGNILAWEQTSITAESRVFTKFDRLINSFSVGTRLALNARSQQFSNQCAFSEYRPLTATLDGRLWVPIGSPIEILVNRTDVNGDYILDENGNILKESVKTYMLSRTLTGIQALTDKIEAKGVR